MSVLLDYLRLLTTYDESVLGSPGFKFMWLAGTLYGRHPLNAEQCEFLAGLRLRSVPRQCFYNAQVAALDYRDTGRLRYCEGLAYRLVPLEHAWLILDGQHVLDPTWTAAPGMFPPDWSYLGVEIPPDAIDKQWRSTRKAGPILPHYFRSPNDD